MHALTLDGAEVRAPGLLPTAYVDLPPVIQRAITRLMTAPLPIVLNAPERTAMAFLLARVDKAGGQKTFWVRRANFAELVGKCTKTVSIWLGKLEAAGLIEKIQGRTTWGSFRGIDLQLTQLAIGLFGLAEPLGRDRVTSADPRSGKKTSHAIEAIGLEQSSSKRPPDLDGVVHRPGEAGGFSSENSTPNTQNTSSQSAQQGLDVVIRARRGEVPDDCRLLLECRVKPSGVLKLMGLATKAGKRLSDIVRACGDDLRSADKAYALVLHMIQDDQDYAARYRLKEQRTAQKTAKEARPTDQRVAGDHELAASAAGVVTAQPLYYPSIRLDSQTDVECWYAVQISGMPPADARERVRCRSGHLPEIYRKHGHDWRFERPIAGTEFDQFWAAAMGRQHWGPASRWGQAALVRLDPSEVTLKPISRNAVMARLNALKQNLLRRDPNGVS